jgi:hypothetical protein
MSRSTPLAFQKVTCRSILLAETNFGVKTGGQNGVTGMLRN